MEIIIYLIIGIIWLVVQAIAAKNEKRKFKKTDENGSKPKYTFQELLDQYEQVMQGKPLDLPKKTTKQPAQKTFKTKQIKTSNKQQYTSVLSKQNQPTRSQQQANRPQSRYLEQNNQPQSPNESQPLPIQEVSYKPIKTTSNQYQKTTFGIDYVPLSEQLGISRRPSNLSKPSLLKAAKRAKKETQKKQSINVNNFQFNTRDAIIYDAIFRRKY